MGKRSNQLRNECYKEAPSLQGPLNDLLQEHGDQLELLRAQVQVSVLASPVVNIGPASTPSTQPWPIRLGQVPGSVVGVSLVNAENLTTPGVAGVSTSAIALNGWSADGGTVLVRFVTGLTLLSKYRLTFAVYTRTPNG
jgi:hypothetical protein